MSRGDHDPSAFVWACGGFAIGVSVAVAMFFWLLGVGSAGGESPFTLAQFSATLGGFVLIGGLVDRTAPNVRKELYRVALLLIIASVGFAVLGMVLPSGHLMSPEDPLTKVRTSLAAVALVIGTVPFSLAIGTLTTVFGKLLRLNDRHSGCC